MREQPCPEIEHWHGISWTGDVSCRALFAARHGQPAWERRESRRNDFSKKLASLLLLKVVVVQLDGKLAALEKTTKRNHINPLPAVSNAVTNETTVKL